MIDVLDYNDRETWLANRWKSLGASEISIVCGFSNFMTEQELWEEKTQRRTHKDNSGNELIEYGRKAEEHLRELFKLKHKGEYEVDYNAFRVYRNGETPFITSTLDGLIIRLADGKYGSYECKTVYVKSKQTLESWNNKIPNGYYCQVLHQIYTADLDFAVLNAELRFPDNNSEIREYLIEREKVQADIEFIVKKAKQFWRYVETDKKPPVSMTL